MSNQTVLPLSTRLLFGLRQADDQIGRAFFNLSNWTARLILPRPTNDEMTTALTASPPPAISRARVLDLLAQDLSALGHRTSPIEIQPLTPEIFHSLYDSRCPTIGITAQRGGTGFGIAGVSAAKAHASGNPLVNLVYLPGPDEHTMQVQAGSPGAAYATAGFLVDRSGQVFYGNFPHPLHLDWIDAPVGAIAELADREGIRLLVTPDGEQVAREKDLTDLQLRAHGIATPPTVVVDRHNADFIIPQIGVLLGANSIDHQGFVVKPAASCCGQDVFLIEESDADAVPLLCAMLLEGHAKLVVQRRVTSAELRGQGHERLDWNLRVLATTQGTVDWEARVAPWGKRVNKSQGAEVWEVPRLWQQLAAQTVNPELEFSRFTQRIDELSRLLCTIYRTEFMGYDIIVTQAGMPCVIEVNIGNPGGICTLAAMRSTTSDRLRATDTLISHWNKLPRQPHGAPEREAPHLSAATLPSVNLRERALERAAYPDHGEAPLLRYLVHEASALTDEQRAEALLALTSRHRSLPSLAMTLLLKPLLGIGHHALMRSASGLKDTVALSITDALIGPWRDLFRRVRSSSRPPEEPDPTAAQTAEAPEPVRDELRIRNELVLALSSENAEQRRGRLSALLSHVEGPAGTPFLKLEAIRFAIASHKKTVKSEGATPPALTRRCIQLLHQLAVSYHGGFLSNIHWLARAGEVRALTKMLRAPISHRQSLQLMANPRHPSWQLLGKL